MNHALASPDLRVPDAWPLTTLVKNAKCKDPRHQAIKIRQALVPHPPRSSHAYLPMLLPYRITDPTATTPTRGVVYRESTNPLTARRRRPSKQSLSSTSVLSMRLQQPSDDQQSHKLEWLVVWSPRTAHAPCGPRQLPFSGNSACELVCQCTERIMGFPFAIKGFCAM